MTRAVESRQLVDRVVGRLRGRHQEVALVPVDEQHRTVQRGESSDVVALRTRVEHADRVHARIGSEFQRQDPATGLAHDRHAVERDLAVQRRPGSCVLRVSPDDGPFLQKYFVKGMMIGAVKE